MTDTTTGYFRMPLLFATASCAFVFTVLYAVDVVLPGAVGALAWIGLAILFFLCLKRNSVPLVSLSFASVLFYVYIAIMFVWPLIYPQVFISTYSKGQQTADVFAKANHLAAIGLAAFLSGWLLMMPLPARHAAPKTRRTPAIPAEAFTVLVCIAVPFVMLSFPTENIFTTAYSGKAGSEIAGAALIELNVVRPAVFICLVFTLAALVQRPTFTKKAIFGVLFGTGIAFGFISGTRLEQVGCLLGIGYVIQCQRAERKLPKRWIIAGAAFAVSMLILGEARGLLSSRGLNTELLIDATTRAFQLRPTEETLQMKPSNNGDIAVTLCAVIGLIDGGILQVDNGETFWRYLQMTLPRFANPNRPIELQVLLRDGGRTGGGLFILAEPLLAGGSIGVFLVLAAFGALVGFLEGRALTGRAGAWTGTFYILFLSCVPTWFLYSILSMYKYILTGTLIALVAHLAPTLAARRAQLPRTAWRRAEFTRCNARL